MRWSDALSDQAQKLADEAAKESPLDLNKLRRQPGENVAVINLNSLNVGKDSADTWGQEVSKFDFVSPLVTRKNQDFVQLVWKSAKEFGLGVAKSKDKSNWIIASVYDAPIKDEYKEIRTNVESDTPLNDPYGDIIG